MELCFAVFGAIVLAIVKVALDDREPVEPEATEQSKDQGIEQ